MSVVNYANKTQTFRLANKMRVVELAYSLPDITFLRNVCASAGGLPNKALVFAYAERQSIISENSRIAHVKL